MSQSYRQETPWFQHQLIDRFCRYARIFTTSDPKSLTKPSSTNQWDLLNLLADELKALRVPDIQIDPSGYVYGRINASSGAEHCPCIAFLAHVDTSPDANGKNVVPLIHENYSGEPLILPAGITLDPQNCPILRKYQGQTLITSDGSTLLGADDKAGIAEIMTVIEFLIKNPQFPHPSLEIVFTSDEEIGRGTENFPFSLLKSQLAYTIDGGEEGCVEKECYNALCAKVTFHGQAHHPGSARGILVNAIAMASLFVTLLPRNESPEATDGYWGCLWPHNVEGTLEQASVEVFIRDFDWAQAQRRLNSLKAYAQAVEAAFQGGKVAIHSRTQYLNMKNKLDERPEVFENLLKAVKATGIEPYIKPIRGGTDGALLTAQGLLTPNIFTGGMNYHSRTEWVAVPVMVKTCQVILELARLWATTSFSLKR